MRVLCFLILFCSTVAFPLDLLSGADKPEFRDPRIERACGSETMTFAMRAVLIPRIMPGPQGQSKTEIVMKSDDPGLPQVTLYSEKLQAHLRKKKNKVVTVVFRRKRVMVGLEPMWELTTCLIDGEPVAHWSL
jgi:hypothetical protein